MQSFDHKSGKYLDINGAKIYYEVLGNNTAPVLLFLHGGLGNIEDFNKIISKLPEKFKIIGIDNRGHGKSTLNSEELSYELLQKEVEMVLKHLNIDTLTIFGFSNGGTIAYRLAALTSLKINKIITIGSPWCTRHVEHLMGDFSKLTGDHWREQCPLDYESYQQLNPEPDFNKLCKLAINMALDTSDKGRPNECVKNISCPIFIARGENDPVVSNSDIVELSKHVKNSQIFDIPLAGHETALYDPPKLFIEKLKKFLAN